jgi:hypothetical protein
MSYSSLRVFLHVPKLRIIEHRYLSKTQPKTSVNRIYNLANIDYLDYDDEKKQLVIKFSSGHVETLTQQNDQVEDIGSLKKVYQDITRNLFTSEGARVIQL